MNSENSLARLEREGKLKRQNPEIGVMNDLLDGARRNFEAAKIVQGKADEAAFKLYYDGLLQIGRVVILTSGYRPVGVQQHKTTFDVAGEILGPDFSDLIRKIQKFRIKRNACVYDPPGSYPYESIRGETVQIYGKGLYRHMSADVAIQGIAQDYVTLFIGIPLLVISLIGFRRNSLRSRFLLAGTMGYFWVTFLFYTAMGMYNIMFLGYVALLCFSSFGLIMMLLSLDVSRLDRHFTPKTPAKIIGGFLIFNSLTIALLGLGGIVPPLLDGTIYPDSLQHYTTLIVQGFDLGMLLPLAFVSGRLLIRRKPLGYLAGTVYFVFLSILMTALTAKIIAMALNGVNVVPVIFIIPAINGISILCAYSMIRNVLDNSPETGQGS